MNHPENTPVTKSSMDFSEITFAYLRPVKAGVAVCNANGEEMAVFKTRDEAYFAAKQHDLEPMLLH